MDTVDLLILGAMGYFLYSQSVQSAPVVSPYNANTYSPGGGIPEETGPGGQTAGTVTSPLVAPAQTTINQEISQQRQMIGAGASVATAAVSTLAAMHLLAASVAGPIGIAIGAVVVLVEALVSDTHLYANQLVQRYENPFGQYVIGIIQSVTNEYNANTLTLDEATGARDAVVGSWETYQNMMHQIQTQGTDWYIVSTQSLNNLDNQYLGTTLPNGKTLGVGEGGAYGSTPNYGFMSSWIDWLNARVVELGGIAS